ncbi:hypothetical protein ABPG72_019805 [Tetrahymena utriculariae]
MKFIFQIEEKVTFCRKHINDNLENAIFLDECSVQTYLYQKKQWYHKNEPIKKVTQPKYPVKLHIWGAISLKGPALLYIFQENLNAELYSGAKRIFYKDRILKLL